ncbi:MAG: UbiA family prenyltransferase [Anaerolineae bacterium]
MEIGSRPEATGPILLVPVRQGPAATASLLVALLKPRVAALLLLAAFAGALLQAGGWPGARPLAVLTLVGGPACCGCSILNQYLERHSDRLMARTRHRPLAAGTLAPAWASIGFGSSLILLPAAVVAPTNPALAAFVLLGALIYLGVYTAWLKPRTSLNIVIGGAAGSCAVLSGAAATGDWWYGGTLLLALLVFLWTPVHFWSLATMHREDYARAGIPMLPVTNPRAARVWLLAYAVASGAASLLLAVDPRLGTGYLLVAGAAVLAEVRAAATLLRTGSADDAHRLFRIANFALGALLLAICLALA